VLCDDLEKAGEQKMSRPLSQKQLAIAATAAVYDTYVDRLRKDDPEKVFSTGAIMLKFISLLELISNVTIADLEAAEKADERIMVADIEWLPSTLRVLKDHRNKAMAELITSAHDKRRTDHLPINQLWYPSLFAELDYERARELDLIIGKGDRVKVCDSTPDHWLRNDKIEEENWEGQKASWNGKIKHRKARLKLFRLHPDCHTTDQLLIKLGGWKQK
jgi:hypothetical protein